MGFRPKPKIYTLQFEGAEFDGLVVKARSLSTGKFLDITERAQAASDDPKSMKGSTRQLFEDFCAAIVEWNLERDDGTPWPVGVDALLAQDFTFNMAVIGAWMDAIGGVSAPLVASSTGGGPALEASIPMDVSSPSPPS